MSGWYEKFLIFLGSVLLLAMAYSLFSVAHGQEKKPEPKPIARDAYYELESAGKQVLLDRQQLQTDQDKYIALFSAACDAAGVKRDACQPADIKPEAKK